MSQRFTRLTPAQYREMPWRNGGGSTTEITIEPTDAGLGTAIPFVWRLSMARVETAGPFSRFAGYDRTLVLLEGRGMHLDFGAEAPAVTLDTPLAHVDFSGDWATTCTLLGGPVRDFNVMVDRQRAIAQVLPLSLVSQQPWSGDLRGNTTLLYVPEGRVKLQFGPTEAEQIVSEGETLRLDTSQVIHAAQIHSDSVAAQIILVQITLR